MSCACRGRGADCVIRWAGDRAVVNRDEAGSGGRVVLYWMIFAYTVGPFLAVAWFAALTWSALWFAEWRERVEGGV